MADGLSVVLVCSHPVALSVSIGLYHIVLGFFHLSSSCNPRTVF